MMFKAKSLIRLITTVVVFSIYTSTFVVSISARPTNTGSQAAQQTSSGRFPMVLKLSSGSALIYQPQIASWDQQKSLVAWSAVLFERTGSNEQLFGTIKFGAN